MSLFQQWAGQEGANMQHKTVHEIERKFFFFFDGVSNFLVVKKFFKKILLASSYMMDNFV